MFWAGAVQDLRSVKKTLGSITLAKTKGSKAERVVYTFEWHRTYVAVKMRNILGSVACRVHMTWHHYLIIEVYDTWQTYTVWRIGDTGVNSQNVPSIYSHVIFSLSNLNGWCLWCRILSAFRWGPKLSRIHTFCEVTINVTFAEHVKICDIAVLQGLEVILLVT